MRRAHICAAVGVAVALTTPALAQADITPVLKPDGAGTGVKPLAKPTPTPKRSTPPPAKQPVRQPTVTQTARRVVTPPAVHTQMTTHTAKRAVAHTAVVKPVTVHGGRKAPIARVKRNRISFSSIGSIFPTRLASVGHDSLPSYETWPSWVLGAFTFLASAEAFLLVRLGRSRRFHREGAVHPFADH
jgi:hypothetical protein